jgi:gliding motility-associated-like protein
MAANGIHAQVVINEILVDATGADGTPPNSSEWVELYNTSGTAIDIGCMVVGDGDFTITIPAGTMLGANETFLIGSAINGLTPNLNWATCGCSSSLVQTGSLTDAAEQVYLVDATGNLLDGVYWGAGSFPAAINSIALVTCNAITGVTFADNTGFTLITVVTGQTNALDCTGSFVNDPTPTPGGTNSDQLPVAVIGTSPNVICQSTTVNFDGASSVGASTISWSFSNATPSNSTDLNPIGITFNSSGTQTATLTVTNSCGQTNSTFVTIQVDAPSLPIISASGPLDICEGTTVDLSTAAAGTLQWKKDGTDITGETGAIYSADQTGSYTVAANNGVCTDESTPVVVTIFPVPVASITTTDTEVCIDEPLTIEAAAGYDAYTWLENGNTIGTLASYDVITTVDGTFNYQLIVTQGICESLPIDITAVVHPMPAVGITPAGPLDVCPGDEIVLNSINTHEQYQWYQDGAPLGNRSSLNITYQQAATISLEGTNNGCTTMSVNVEVISHPVATIATWMPPPYALDNTLHTCLDSHPILASSNGSIFQWYQNGAAMSGETGLSITAQSDGIYYYTASIDGFCPIYSDTIDVNLEMSLAIETIATADTACVGDTVQIVPSGNFVTYTWNGGLTADTITVTNSGVYIVTGHLVSCDTTDTVSVYFSPYPVVDAGRDFYSDCEDNTWLYGISDGDSTYWEVDNLVVAYGDTALIPTPTRSSEFIMVSNLNKCEVRDTVNMTVDCVYIYAPTAITPDGDGLNDMFRIYTNGLTQYTLRIFNRYGQLVWETSDPEDVWTGGAPDYYLPNGVYTWQIDALDYNQQEALGKKKNKGSILVIR